MCALETACLSAWHAHQEHRCQYAVYACLKQRVNSLSPRCLFALQHLNTETDCQACLPPMNVFSVLRGKASSEVWPVNSCLSDLRREQWEEFPQSPLLASFSLCNTRRLSVHRRKGWSTMRIGQEDREGKRQKGRQGLGNPSGNPSLPGSLERSDGLSKIRAAIVHHSSSLRLPLTFSTYLASLFDPNRSWGVWQLKRKTLQGSLVSVFSEHVASGKKYDLKLNIYLDTWFPNDFRKVSSWSSRYFNRYFKTESCTASFLSQNKREK